MSSRRKANLQSSRNISSMDQDPSDIANPPFERRVTRARQAASSTVNTAASQQQQPQTATPPKRKSARQTAKRAAKANPNVPKSGITSHLDMNVQPSPLPDSALPNASTADHAPTSNGAPAGNPLASNSSPHAGLAPPNAGTADHAPTSNRAPSANKSLAPNSSPPAGPAPPNAGTTNRAPTSNDVPPANKSLAPNFSPPARSAPPNASIALPADRASTSNSSGAPNGAPPANESLPPNSSPHVGLVPPNAGTADHAPTSNRAPSANKSLAPNSSPPAGPAPPNAGATNRAPTSNDVPPANKSLAPNFSPPARSAPPNASIALPADRASTSNSSAGPNGAAPADKRQPPTSSPHLASNTSIALADGRANTSTPQKPVFIFQTPDWMKPAAQTPRTEIPSVSSSPLASPTKSELEAEAAYEKKSRQSVSNKRNPIPRQVTRHVKDPDDEVMESGDSSASEYDPGRQVPKVDTDSDEEPEVVVARDESKAGTKRKAKPSSTRKKGKKRAAKEPPVSGTDEPEDAEAEEVLKAILPYDEARPDYTGYGDRTEVPTEEDFVTYLDSENIVAQLQSESGRKKDFLQTPTFWKVKPGPAPREAIEEMDALTQNFAVQMLGVGRKFGLSKGTVWKHCYLLKAETRKPSRWNLFQTYKADQLKEENGKPVGDAHQTTEAISSAWQAMTDEEKLTLTDKLQRESIQRDYAELRETTTTNAEQARYFKRVIDDLSLQANQEGMRSGFMMIATCFMPNFHAGKSFVTTFVTDAKAIPTYNTFKDTYGTIEKSLAGQEAPVVKLDEEGLPVWIPGLDKSLTKDRDALRSLLAQYLTAMRNYSAPWIDDRASLRALKQFNWKACLLTCKEKDAVLTGWVTGDVFPGYCDSNGKPKELRSVLPAVARKIILKINGDRLEDPSKAGDLPLCWFSIEDLWIDVDGRLLVLPPGTPEVDTKGERQFWPASILPKGDRPLLVNTDGETMVMVKDLDESDRILSDATKSFASEDKNAPPPLLVAPVKAKIFTIHQLQAFEEDDEDGDVDIEKDEEPKPRRKKTVKASDASKRARRGSKRARGGDSLSDVDEQPERASKRAKKSNETPALEESTEGTRTRADRKKGKGKNTRMEDA